ncbi:nucleotidyltransferase substrate binding protein [Candidatus Marinamargulisbacteria bacterium]|nr:nucleotidyltransferase substrate binding protein [Candidatus Marinamargulisbacteria bacterium]
MPEKRESLDPSVLVSALTSFSKALDEYKKDESNDFIRDSVIQRFEFCYDLSVKFIKRHLSLISANPSAINEMSFQEIIREAYTKGILRNSWDTWWKYRDDRNATSHAYSEAKAIEVAGDVEAFLIEADYLVEHLKAKYEA